MSKEPLLMPLTLGQQDWHHLDVEISDNQPVRIEVDVVVLDCSKSHSSVERIYSATWSRKTTNLRVTWDLINCTYSWNNGLTELIMIFWRPGRNQVGSLRVANNANILFIEMSASIFSGNSELHAGEWPVLKRSNVVRESAKSLGGLILPIRQEDFWNGITKGVDQLREFSSSQESRDIRGWLSRRKASVIDCNKEDGLPDFN